MAKRVKVTGTGKIMTQSASNVHKLEHKSSHAEAPSDRHR